MTIQLTPEQEQLIGRAIEAGLIKTAGDVVGVGVETIQRRLEERRTLVGSIGQDGTIGDLEFHIRFRLQPELLPNVFRYSDLATLAYFHT